MGMESRQHGTEPAVLADGKAFGRTAVMSYLTDSKQVAEYFVDRMRPGVPGRIDLLLNVAEGACPPYYVVIEVKNTQWDRQAPHRVRPNLLRHIRQVWRYLTPLLNELDKGTVSDLQGALLYPSRPRTAGRAALISALAEHEGVDVVYHEELKRSPGLPGDGVLGPTE